MLTSRDRVINSLNHVSVDRAPRDLVVAPAVERHRSDELAELLYRYPLDIEPPDCSSAQGERTRGRPDEAGTYTDAWGCTFEVNDRGVLGAIREYPLSNLAEIAHYRPPRELLDPQRFARVNQGCAATSRFVLAQSECCPFERLQSLRGSEGTLLDLAYGRRESLRLLGTLHEFFCEELERWAATDVDGIAIRDDWGSPTALLIAPQIWRELFAPLYRDYVAIAHAQDKYLFFRSHGAIGEIVGDLVELGADALDAELHRMDLEQVAAEYRDRVTFWGTIADETMLGRSNGAQIRGEVDRLRAALDYGRGGLIARCVWAPGVPFQNLVSLLERFSQPTPMKPPSGVPSPHTAWQQRSPHPR